MRLRSKRARDVHFRQGTVVDQNIENSGLAVQTRARAIDLLAAKKSSVLENAEHIVFVVLHLGKKAAPSLAQTCSISSSGDQPQEYAKVYDQTYLTLVVITSS